MDGQVAGKAREFDGSSAVLSVAPGKHVITLKADGYEPFSTQLYISDSQEVIEINLKESP